MSVEGGNQRHASGTVKWGMLGISGGASGTMWIFGWPFSKGSGEGAGMYKESGAVAQDMGGGI